MDHQMVLRSLLEVFPQVDLRILKAVAIDHRNDVDGAVEFVLLEVLPVLTAPTEPLHSPSYTPQMGSSSSGVVMQESSLENVGAEEEENACQFETCPVVDVEKSNFLPYDKITEDSITNLPSAFPPLESVVTPINSDYPEEQVTAVEYISETVRALDESSGEVLQSDTHEMCETDGTPNVAEVFTSPHTPPSVNELKYLVEAAKPLVTDLSQREDTSDLVNGSAIDELKRCSSVSGEEHSRDISKNISEMVGLEIDTSLASEEPILEATQSGHMIRMDVLEDFINDAKSNKENLVSAYETLCYMMKDVEVQEERAKLAKEEASMAGHDILFRAEDMSQILTHARGANEMRAGEIFGEKAILAAEARELQSRLLGLADEKEKSLSIVQEIQRSLEARLVAAMERQNASELEKLEKEEAANKILKEQEVSMDEVVQESKRLESEAEENAKLRDFLVHRGAIVDKLQGEIAVVCEDVVKLKERVEGNIPLNKSRLLTSSLASSSSYLSSHGSLLSDGDLPPSVAGESPTKSSGKGSTNGDKKIIAGVEGDDDWEKIFGSE